MKNSSNNTNLGYIKKFDINKVRLIINLITFEFRKYINSIIIKDVIIY